jgi:hypothetical protein
MPRIGIKVKGQREVEEKYISRKNAFMVMSNSTR